MQTNVLEYFESGALSRCPEKVALKEQTRSYSFAEIGHYAKNCAAMIVARTGDIAQSIPVYLPKSGHNIIANIGVLYSANAYANLDVKSPAQRIGKMIDNLAPEIVVTSYAYASSLLEMGVAEEKLLYIDQAITPDQLYDEAVLRKRRAALIDTDPYCIIHTSGSTGIPKGVALHHRSTIDFVDWALERLQLDGSEMMGSLAPIYFDAYTLELCMMMAKGSTMVIVPDSMAMFPVRLVDFLLANAINFIFWVPTIMVNIANLNLLKGKDLSLIRKVLFIGEVFPTKHLNYWRKHLSDAMFVNLYGPIEITVACTYFIVDREFTDDEKIPVGCPCGNTDVLILSENNERAATGEIGEICVRGSSLALGYYNNFERTAKGFVQNPLNRHYPELIYKTGDVGFWNERGEVMFLGRRDFQVKHLGYRIELGEIEHAALQMEGIRNCCVVYRDQTSEIVLFYESGREMQPASIRAKLSNTLPKYMLPTVFHWMDLMPRNPNGKIDRAQLVGRVKV